MENKTGKRGQVTIFIIIAVLIFAGILSYITLRSSFTSVEVPVKIEPVYTAFLACLEQDTVTGISLLGTQGGYIELPDFEEASRFSPFSSQLNFLGNPIPYWYYLSGNNLEKNQVPSKSDMEFQLEKFIERRLGNCEFRVYRDQGFEVLLEEPKVSVSIQDEKVEVSLDVDLTVKFEDESVFIKNHKVVVDSKFGTLYKSAKEVYDKEQNDLFLEEYGIDVLRLYAPVDGVEITCSPLVWNANEIFDELQDAIEINTLALGTDRDESYFNVELPTLRGQGQEVTFLNSKYWPNALEINPSDNEFLTANPVGNQPGLGILGFCYVPYHFVYNLKYSVLVQIQDKTTQEIFQFPMAVVIQGNQARKSLSGEAPQNVIPELCTYKNTEIQIRTRSSDGDPIDAEISYECFGTKCNIGSAENGLLKEDFPQCVNGYVLAREPGFKDARFLFSTVSPGSLDVVLEKL